MWRSGKFTRAICSHKTLAEGGGDCCNKVFYKEDIERCIKGRRGREFLDVISSSKKGVSDVFLLA